MSKNPPAALAAIPAALERGAGLAALLRPTDGTMAYAGGAEGGYNGARTDKASLSNWRIFGGSPRTDIINGLQTLRHRARDLDRNSAVGAAAVNTTVTHVIGTGLAGNPQIDGAFLGLTEAQRDTWQRETRRRFRAWCDSKDVDLARELNFFGMQDLGFRSTLTSGDSFVVTPLVERAGIPGKRLALQLIEADLCSNPDNNPDTRTLTQGIEHDATTGEALACYFSAVHPNDTYALAGDKNTWTKVEMRGRNSGRRNVLHLYRMLRPGQRRGVPYLAPVMEPIKQLNRYTEAELSAAVTSALFSVFLKMDPKAFDETFDNQGKADYLQKAMEWSGEFDPSSAINLLPGESVETVNPSRPNAEFDPFTTSCIRQIGMGLGLPYEVLVMHYQSSYSAARAALLMAWKFFMGWRDWMATHFCQPVYELWLADEVASGRISAPGFFRDRLVRHAWCQAVWIGDGPGSIDPEKEVRAAKERVGLGISTLQAESILHDGIDWETKHAQTVREAKAREEAGLLVPGAAAPAPTAEPAAEAENAPAGGAAAPPASE